MAGMGSRFNYQFKPFLEINGSTFIEAAVKPFLEWKHRIASFRFVTLRTQEQQYNVSARLDSMFPTLPIQNVCLADPTSGPAETVNSALAIAPLEGPVIICDCDHQLDVSPLIRIIDNCLDADCVIPTWEISPDEVDSWSIAYSPDNKRVQCIAEKQWPTPSKKGHGVIGCYFFRDAVRLSQLIARGHCLAISQAIQDLIDCGGIVYEQRIGNARVFGDPQRLRKASIESEALNGNAVSN